jgi:hypothetical protein
VSTGNSKSFEPTLNVFNSNALTFIDYAIAQAGMFEINRFNTNDGWAS